MTTSAHPEFLVDPRWVQDHAGDSNLALVDIAGGEVTFLEGHAHLGVGTQPARVI